jgi:hypothetical protein
VFYLLSGGYQPEVSCHVFFLLALGYSGVGGKADDAYNAARSDQFSETGESGRRIHVMKCCDGEDSVKWLVWG